MLKSLKVARMRTAVPALGVVLLATAAAAWLLWVITPLIHDGSDSYPFWEILNYFMAFSILVALLVNAVGKRAYDRANSSDGPITRRWLTVNLLFFASLVLAAWFYWNWFFNFFPESEPAAADIHLEMWTLINTLFYLTCGMTGYRMLRGA